MPVIHFDARELERLLGKPVPREDLIRDIPMIGADVDDVDGDAWAIEFFPNRPDHYTVEGIARTLRAWYGFAPGLREYEATPARHAVYVDPAVDDVRPHVVGAFVRGVDMTEARLDALIELQEDLHHGLGVRRRKVAIGVHDAGPLKPPFYYTTTTPDGVRFEPLGAPDSEGRTDGESGTKQETREMTPREILAEHPKGKDYAHILEKHDRYPIIVDADGQVLSLPPIINGTLTEVTTSSTDLFVDVTGTDPWAVSKALNILTSSLAESGATVEAVAFKRLAADGPAPDVPVAERQDALAAADAWEDLPTTPDFATESWTLHVETARRLLGLDLSAWQIADRLQRLGHGATPSGEGAVDVRVPCYRVDVQHEHDLVEDVAIGHGINAFEHADPQAVTTGRANPALASATKARASLVGLGFMEAMSLALTSPEDQFARMGLERGWAVEMRNALSEEYSILRVSLIPSLLNLLKRNAHRDLPQRLFEVGVVHLQGEDGLPRSERRVAGVSISSRADFAEVKGTALGLARDLGWSYGQELEKVDHPGFIPGRAATLPGVGGVLGEVHPRTLNAFELGHPVVAFEFPLGPAGATLAGAPAEWASRNR